MIVFLYHHSPAPIVPTDFAIVWKKKLPVHFKSIPHKIELLKPFVWIVELVREESLWSQILRAASVVSIGTLPPTTNLDLIVHPNQILMLGWPVNALHWHAALQ